MQQGRLDIDKLIELAATEFAAHGFEGMSMRSLADKCAISQPAIYYHFASKEALYEEVCRRRFDEVARLVDRRVAAVTSPADKLEEFFSALFDEWQRDNTILLLTQREVINALVEPEKCVAGTHTIHLFGQIEDILADILGREVEQEVAFTFGSLLYGYCSMMSLDIKGDGRAPTQQPALRERRKAALLDACRKMLQSLGS